MRNLIYLILFTINCYSASLTLNIAKDDNIDFSILHIKDDKKFLCEIKMREDFKDIVVCTFMQNINPPISRSDRDFKIDSNKNILNIIPTNKMMLQSLQDDFIVTNIIKSDVKSMHKHWIVVGYKDEMKLFKTNDKNGINFDIVFQNKELPHVGSLDLDAQPITQKNDAVSMSRIRKAYEEKRYSRVLKLADDMSEDKKSTFSKEAKLYKLRALDALAWENGEQEDIDTDELLDVATSWISENPSSIHLSEVLMYIAKTYYKLGYVNKGDEYSNILKEEFYDSRYTKLAQLYKADRIYKNRKRRVEAINIYKDVLYNTKDLMIASAAASKISEKYLDANKIDLAYKFYKKVVDANEKYLLENRTKSYEFAKRFAKEGKFDLAIEIIAILLSDKDENFQTDEMQKDLAYWYELRGDKETSYWLYREYLNSYKSGRYVEFVKNRIDKILLDIDEQNSSKKMKNINNILSKYPNEPIYKKALIEKAKILINEKKYDQLFAIEGELKKIGAQKYLQYGADKKIVQDLNSDNCKDAIYLREEYNATTPQKLEVKLFECLMRFNKYNEALNLTQKYQNEKDLKIKLDWMYKSAKAHSKLDHNKRVILLGEDIEKLSKVVKTRKYDDIVYLKAEAYYNLQEYDEMMLKEVKQAQKLFPFDIRNIDLFMKVVRYAKKRKIDLLIVDYAQKIIELQKRHKIEDYSPNIELDYINALKRLKQYEKALKEDLKLLFVKLTDLQKANVLYIAGELSLKTDKPKEAKEFFMKCGEIVEDSLWQRLCAQSLELLDE